MIPPKECAMKIIGRFVSYMIKRVNSMIPLRKMRRMKLRLEEDALHHLSRAHRSSYPVGLSRDPIRQQ